MASACPNQLDACAAGGSILLRSTNQTNSGDGKSFAGMACGANQRLCGAWLANGHESHYTQMEGRHEMFTAFR
jgi:hypothetical protein